MYFHHAARKRSCLSFTLSIFSVAVIKNASVMGLSQEIPTKVAQKEEKSFAKNLKNLDSDQNACNKVELKFCRSTKTYP